MMVSGVGVLSTPVEKAEAAQAETALTALSALTVSDSASMSGYSRSQFGEEWADVDGNGYDTRDDILKRDLTKVTYGDSKHCEVTSGTLSDPYTGKTISFHRGKTTSTAVQIDHVVALGNAWSTGAQSWSATQRESPANDPLNLLAVDGDANEAKGDKDASSWIPSETTSDCAYVARQITVKKKYSLWVTSSEKSAMSKVLATCPNQSLATSSSLDAPASAPKPTLTYRTHVQTYGWQGWVNTGAMSGTSGKAKRLEAISIRLTSNLGSAYDVYYRVHAQHFGWMGWAKDGADAGTAGYAYRLEAIQITLVRKGGSAPGSTSNAFRQKTSTAKKATSSKASSSKSTSTSSFKKAKSSKGVVLTCKTSASDSWLRWRK
ncbi:DUF1524 domain-containing protein [uncultured Bifidobacterium sp.]|uniref:GmrSD restriction endonuclease domain-containing protein n=1 Tax=uncultured Bifidobacterium sp. TaxID=165187 RepID=UPI0034573DA0